MKGSSLASKAFRLLFAFLALAGTARAGSGSVNRDGTIDITISLRFPAARDHVAQIEAEVTDASRWLWDASEGQLRLGRVGFTCGQSVEDQPDVWLYLQPGGSHSPADCAEDVLGRAGEHVVQYDGGGDFDHVLAHELGHHPTEPWRMLPVGISS